MQFLGSLVKFNLLLLQITKSQLDDHFPVLSSNAQMTAEGHRHPGKLQGCPGKGTQSCVLTAHSPGRPDWRGTGIAGPAEPAQAQVTKWGWKTKTEKNQRPLERTHSILETKSC